MDEFTKRNIANRMMSYVLNFHKSFKNKPTAKYKKGVFADINKDFTKCDNTGMLQTDHSNSCVSKGYKRYKFKGFDWTEETLMIDLENTTNFLHNDKMEERFAYLIKAYKQNIINERLKSLENDFE